MKQEHPYSLNLKLHTEVLEEKYGKISLQLLYDDDETTRKPGDQPNRAGAIIFLNAKNNNDEKI
jgi:hypothetical protein